ncbi:hypothetical protein MIR68_010380 [Amoeboaphelidium protococcarum]|nr:hypothetical protein MIR68_010380 [Amoeboaphelidium protococcarum]
MQNMKRRVDISRHIPYAAWLWDFLPWRKRLSLKDQQERLKVNALNAGSFKREITEFAQNQGKYYFGASQLIPLSKAQKMPEIAGHDLNQNKSSLFRIVKQQDAKVSLVLIKMRQSGESQLQMWRDAFKQQVMNGTSDNKKVGVVDVVVYESPYMSMFGWLFTRQLRAAVDVKDRVSYLQHYGPLTKERLQLDIKNSLIGWVFLLDQHGNIRWKAHGTPLQEELDMMNKMVKQLLQPENPSSLKKGNKK